MLYLFRNRPVLQSDRPVPPQTTTAPVTLALRWRYVILPLVIFLLTVALVAYFFRLLPTEVAYHFKADGSPDEFMSRGMIVFWALLPQFLLTLLGLAITWGTAKLYSLYQQPESASIDFNRILLLMGNMVALPQVILCFAILDIFSYNAYQVHILPLWVFALIVMGLGAIILGIFFTRAIQQTGGTPK